MTTPHGPAREASRQPTGQGPVLTRRGLLGLSTMVLAGCSAVPDWGPVVQVSPSARAPVERGVVVHPAAPQPGAAPEIVIAGFIDAMASMEPGFRVARQYLTPAAAQRWDPSSTVTLFDGDSRATLAGGQGATLTARLVGRLDPQGHFTPAAGTPFRHDFRMRRLNGQWRIDHPPAGLLLSQYTLQHRFTPTRVWFLGPGERCVVPERVWLPGSPVTPGQAIQALLRGPSSWLAPAVGNALPASLEASAPVVSLDGQVVELSLGRQLLELPDAQRSLAAAQIGWTLRGFDGVTSFRVSIDGQPWLVPGATSQGRVLLDDLLGMSPVPLVATQPALGVVDSRIGSLGDEGQFIAFDGPLGRGGRQVSPGQFSEAAGGRIVLVDSAATGLFIAADHQATPVRRLTGHGLHHPQMSSSGVGWCATAEDASRALRQVGVTGAPVVLTVPALAGAQLVSFSVSPDESVMAVVLRRGAAGELGLLRLRGQHADGYRVLPLSLSGSRLAHLVDVGWTGPDELMVLGSMQADARDSVFLVSSDGAQISETGPAGEDDFVQLATQPQMKGARALLRRADGELLRYEAAWRWSPAGSRLTAVTFPA